MKALNKITWLMVFFMIMPVNSFCQEILAVGSDGHHTFIAVTDIGVEWETANNELAGLNNPECYLATIANHEENNFLANFLDICNIDGEFWLGGYQDPLYEEGQNPWDDWNWVTGEPWDFTDWGTFEGGFEPNDGYIAPFYEPYLTFWNPEHFGGWKWNDEWDHPGITGYIVESNYSLIDILPGSEQNCLNNDGHGVIPVAILGSTFFDVSKINPETIQLEGLEIKAVGKGSRLLAHIEDVNIDQDDFDDLIVQIEDKDGLFQEGRSIAIVTGFLFDGTPFLGMDEICIVKASSKTEALITDDIFIAKNSLKQNYPNPFKLDTDIAFEINSDGNVLLKVYNSVGQEVCTLANQNFKAGLHHISWTGRDMDGSIVPKGIYYCTMQVGDFHDVIRMVMTR